MNTPARPVLSVNVARGLKHMAQGLIQRMPGGEKALAGGLGEVINRAIDQNPRIPKTDFTAVEIAERMGLIQPDRPKRKGRK